MEATTKTATPRQAEAVALRDAGKSNKEIGEALGVTAGAAGNLVVNGLRAMGREGDVGGNGPTGGGRTKPPSALDAIDEAISRVEGSVERASNKVASAEAAVTESTGDNADAWAEAFVAAEVERREKAVVDATAALETARDAVEDEVAKLRVVRDTLAAAESTDDE